MLAAESLDATTDIVEATDSAALTDIGTTGTAMTDIVMTDATATGSVSGHVMMIVHATTIAAMIGQEPITGGRLLLLAEGVSGSCPSR